MSRMTWMLVVSALGFSTGCASSGAIGPNGYTQAQAKYQVTYSDPAKHRFLPEEWTLDNYRYDTVKDKWSEKTGDEYRAIRRLESARACWSLAIGRTRHASTRTWPTSKLC